MGPGPRCYTVEREMINSKVNKMKGSNPPRGVREMVESFTLKQGNQANQGEEATMRISAENKRVEEVKCDSQHAGARCHTG